MSADSIYSWANWTLVAALIVGVAATYAIVVTGKIRDDALKQALATQSERAATLEKEAADANERTAEIMKATAWRQLLPEQARALFEAFREQHGKVLLAWIANDPESLGLATQLSKILTDAHWEVAGSARTYPMNLLWGIWIPDSATAAGMTQTVRSAFARANLQYVTEKLPPEGMSMGGGGGPDFATILVGSRRPTVVQPP